MRSWNGLPLRDRECGSSRGSGICRPDQNHEQVGRHSARHRDRQLRRRWHARQVRSPAAAAIVLASPAGSRSTSRVCKSGSSKRGYATETQERRLRDGNRRIRHPVDRLSTGRDEIKLRRFRKRGAGERTRQFERTPAARSTRRLPRIRRLRGVRHIERPQMNHAQARCASSRQTLPSAAARNGSHRADSTAATAWLPGLPLADTPLCNLNCLPGSTSTLSWPRSASKSASSAPTPRPSARMIHAAACRSGLGSEWLRLPVRSDRANGSYRPPHRPARSVPAVALGRLRTRPAPRPRHWSDKRCPRPVRGSGRIRPTCGLRR